MKKLILRLSIIAMVVTSCSNKDAYVVNGTLPSGEYDGQLVFLQKLDSTWDTRNLVTIDTAEVRDSKFIFKGLTLQGPSIHFVSLDQAPDFLQRPTLLVVEPGTIEISLDTIPTVKGTAINNAYQAFINKEISLEKELSIMYEQVMADTANTELKKDLEEKGKVGRKELYTELYNFISANTENQVGAFLIPKSVYKLELDQINDLMGKLSPDYKSMPKLKSVEGYLERWNATAVGKQFTDVKLLTPEGKEVALSDYVGKGKYVLIDFWASWCGPCIQEIPNIKKAYAQYKDKGFEVVAISLDKKPEAWKQCIKDLGITWPQMSDLKGWDSEAAKLYGVSFIPQTILLDKDGKILQKNLWGDEINDVLAKLLD